MAPAPPQEAQSSVGGSTFQRLRSDEDVAAWRASPSYQEFMGWVMRRAERIKGKEIASSSSEGEECPEVGWHRAPRSAHTLT